ncbi:MAG: hypothetical protein P4L56_27675 [Candidatus Sulfopaludibacter sp.]|nr:hypothetical protein [Candidatus Sulfopaludibacter sp.]
MAKEDGQQLERLALDLNADSALPQLTGSGVDFKYAKPDSAQMGWDLFEHGTSTEYHNRESFRKILSGLLSWAINSCFLKGLADE